MELIGPADGHQAWVRPRKSTSFGQEPALVPRSQAAFLSLADLFLATATSKSHLGFAFTFLHSWAPNKDRQDYVDSPRD